MTGKRGPRTESATDAALAGAELLHRAGVEATGRGEPAVAARELRKALRRLGVAGVPVSPAAAGSAPATDDARTLTPERAALAAKILTSLAHAEAEQGRTALGFALLVRCETLADPADRGKLYGQRGLMLLRIGEAAAALPELDKAVELMDPRTQAVDLARALLNRTVARIETGAFAGARADSERCRALAEQTDRPLLAAKALHNIGYCHLVGGDLPAALGTIGAAADAFTSLGPSWRPVAMLDIARGLLQAGLASEAAQELDAAIDLFGRQRMSQDRAEAQAVRAEAALLAGDQNGARAWARTARTGFLRRGNATGAAAAELIELHAELRLAGGRPGTARALRAAARASDLSGRLRALGLPYRAAAAELVGLRALIMHTRIAKSRGEAASGSSRGTGPDSVPRFPPLPPLPALPPAAPLDLRLLHHLTEAEIAAVGGDRRRALRTLRSGLTLLHRHRARLGSVDLQTGTAALGVELAAAGLGLTADRPRQAFAWSELSRAQSLRIRPVRPPTDPELAQAVAELRRLELSTTSAVLSGTPPGPAARSLRAGLERRIQRSAWSAAGSGTVSRIAALDEVVFSLRERNTALVSLFKNSETLCALVVSGSVCRVLPLGTADAVYETARRLRADIVALVGRELPSRMEKALAEAVTAHAAQLDAALFRAAVRPGRRADPRSGRAPGSGTADDINHLIGDRDLVIVPCGPLAATPWALLPTLRGRPLSAAPSATSWHDAVRSRAASPDVPGRAVLVGGPGLREAGSELAAVAAHYADALLLEGAAARVEPTLRALDGATTAHLAVHGRHDAENPLFSRLELADGPLMAYDLLHLEAVPRHVVLSACDVGRISMRPGDEPLGLVATLLHAGCPTVVAAAAPVADAVAAEVMGTYHRLLRSGGAPARALADATAPNPLAAFSCFGAG